MKLKALLIIILCAIAFQGIATEDTIIYLTRHGETSWNAQKKWQGGGADTTLNIHGIEQAIEKASFFGSMPVDAVYTSPLQRAYLTAQIIAAVHEKVVTVVPGLTEPWIGDLEGMRTDEIKPLIEPRLLSMSQEERRNSGYLEGLLSIAMIDKRATLELEKIVQKHPGKTVVVVAHSDIIRSMIIMRTDAIYELTKMSNMAYLKFKHDGKQLQLLELSPDISYQSY